MKRLILYITFIIFLPLLMISNSGEMLRVKAIGKSSSGITDSSKARILALRAAKVVAYKKLAQSAGLEKFVKEGTKEYVEIQAILKNTKIVEKKYISDHEVEIVMEMPLSDLVDKITNFKKYRFNRSLIDKLTQKIDSMESDLKKMKTGLMELKGILKSLREISE